MFRGRNKPSPSHHPGLLRGLGELLRGLGSCELRLQCLSEDGHFYGETDGKKLEFEWKLQGDNHFLSIFVGEIPVCQKHPHVVVGPEHGTRRTMRFGVEGMFFFAL